jgi:cytochrome c oxidase subunit 3
MGVAILFFSGLAVVAAWWLSSQRVTSKPWIEQGVAGVSPAADGSAAPVTKLGLMVFLATIGSLFALFISAYVMRMQLADWRPVPKPTLLWINTGVLMLSSAALHWARVNAGQDVVQDLRAQVLMASTAHLAFVVGQLLAWGQLVQAGYALTSNPASSFFYLITALHGLHVLGGVAALIWVGARAWQQSDTASLRLGVDLCTLYCDFLLLMWLVLFGLLLLS